MPTSVKQNPPHAQYARPAGSITRNTLRSMSRKLGSLFIFGAAATSGFSFLAIEIAQIRDGRLRVEFLERAIVAQPVVIAPAHHRTRRIVAVAERDRSRRTRLLTRRDDLAVAQLPTLGLLIELAKLDSLHAERALLHHTRAAHRHVRIELQVHRCRPLRHEPVEPAHLVRTVIFAVARADASIVNLAVQAFFGMI